MTKVAAVIMAATSADAERDAHLALQQGADLVEFRFDHIQDFSRDTVRKLAKAFGSRAIATLRSRREGGDDSSAPADRHRLLKDLCQVGFAYADVELLTDEENLESLRNLAARHGTRVIVSQHLAQSAQPLDEVDSLDACAAAGDVAKVGVPVAEFETSLALLDLLRSRKPRKPFVLIGMGDPGTVTRVLAEDAGQEIQYAAFGRAAAPGQLPLRTALRLRGRVPMVLGLVGRPLGHSISPAIHEAALDAADLPGVYLPFDVDSKSLRSLLDSAARLRVRGFNVTIPHKEAIVPELDELDGDAEQIEAVNTVVIGDGWTKGHNTDVYGFRISLRSLGLRLGERTALVIGAGGAAKAVVHVLVREGARVQVANRSHRRAEALADAFDGAADVVSMEDLYTEGPWDLLVNATPVGTKGGSDALPVPEAVVAEAAFVYDLVYNPPQTPLLQAAKRLGKPGTSGLDMLLHQAAKSFELWTDRAAPFGAMVRAAKEALG